MKILLTITIGLCLISIVGCDINGDEKGIKDSRESYMDKLEVALTEKNIPYYVDDEGYIKYPEEYAEAVNMVVDDIDSMMSTEIGTKFDDELSTQYFRELLKERDIEYRTESRETGEWTYWVPASDTQEEELNMTVAIVKEYPTDDCFVVEAEVLLRANHY